MSSQPPGVTSNVGRNKTLELIIDKAFLEAERTCTSPWVISYSRTLDGVPIDFHTLLKILGVVACLINCLCCAYLMTGHTVYWVRPAEQRQMMRIIIFDVIFSITSFFSIYFYSSAVYNHAWAMYYEGLAMTALFLLYVQLVCPDPNHRAQYFHDLQPKSKGAKAQKSAGGSLNWYRSTWIKVFQVVLTRVATVIAQIVVEAVFCPLSKTKSYASTAIQAVSSFSTGITVFAIIAFESRMHNHLKNHGHRPLLKLLSFKLVVGLDATQNILFTALADTGVYFPKWPYHVSWMDFSVGIPALILIWELTIVSIMFLWSFTFEPYKKLALEQREKVQPQSWKALVEALDMSDVYRGVKYMFTCYTSSEYLEGPVDGRIPQGLPEHPASDSDETHVNDLNRSELKPHHGSQM